MYGEQIQHLIPGQGHKSTYGNPTCLLQCIYPIDNFNAARVDLSVYSCERKVSPASTSYFTSFIHKEPENEQTACFNVDGASGSCVDHTRIASQPIAESSVVARRPSMKYGVTLVNLNS